MSDMLHLFTTETILKEKISTPCAFLMLQQQLLLLLLLLVANRLAVGQTSESNGPTGYVSEQDPLHLSTGDEMNKEKYKNAAKFLDSVLNESDSRIGPHLSGYPVLVRVDFYVQSFGPVDEVNMEFEIGMFFRQRWVDPRLSYTGSNEMIYVPDSHIHLIWKPDLFFVNEVSGILHDLTVKNHIVNIYPNGTVWYSARMTVRMDCFMDLSNFPFDIQHCYIRINSYSYDVKSVILEWLYSSPSVEYNTDRFILKQFYVNRVTTTTCNTEYKTGNFSCLQASFFMRRHSGSFILSSYIPSILIVCLSWVSFWISKNAVPARVSLGVTTVLTIVTQLGNSKSTNMQVSYPRAIDVWYTTCMAFVFLAQLEYAIVNVLSRSELIRFKNEEQSRRSIHQIRNNWRHSRPSLIKDKEQATNDTVVRIDEDSTGTADTTVCEPSGNRKSHNRLRRFGAYYFATSKGVDDVSRFLFPFTFLAFNLFYWPYYTRDLSTYPDEM